MFLLFVSLVAFATAVPYSLTDSPAASPYILARSTPIIDALTSTCIPGTLVCRDTPSQGICPSVGPVVFGPVPAGTKCLCYNNGKCEFVGIGSIDSSPSNAASGQSQSGPVATVTVTSTVAIQVPAPTNSSSNSSIFIPMPASPSAVVTEPSSVAAAPSSSAETTSIASSSATAPGQTSATSGGTVAMAGAKYTQFTGDGSVAAGWPSMDEWVTFEQLWQGAQSVLSTSCSTYGIVPNNSPADIAALKAALLSAPQSAGVPDVFALATVLQESGGCTGVNTTNYGVRNPGLMQSHDGSGTCYGKATCPPSEIKQMIEDGVGSAGSTAGPGLSQCSQQEPASSASGAQKWYITARLYNSGSVSASDGDLAEGGATPCYASDMANRLVGWVDGTSQCTLD